MPPIATNPPPPLTPTPTPTKHHYSLRLNPPPPPLSSPSSPPPSRLSVPPTTTTLSIDYSFLSDLCPLTGAHPPLARVLKRIAKHLKHLSAHCPSLRTLKLILLTRNCCAECHEDALNAGFGWTRPGREGSGGKELSLVQRALEGVRVGECFGVCVYVEREGGGLGGRGVEVPEEIGLGFSEGQMRVQGELERARDWPVAMSWWRWK
ncbi:MAG: hypothetical protein HETSPECPRED_007266 [Heterodermia speciosa]|uniref:Uncharacterized protein n=1 Tax=Heterodermia speciosa TaxID=116794 RepID=A0A8H3IPX5_9LECA|nr:MAG: hypothetical protein HETSPECPRED_007266 [Heterodermia speciosa]